MSSSSIPHGPAAGAGTGGGPGARFSLAGKVAVVTGASKGMGAAIAEAMAEAGARVALVARDQAYLDAVAGRIRAAGGTALPLAVDINADGAAARIVDATVAELGGLNVLVNNAGIFWPKPFEETPIEELDAQLATNVRAPFLLTQRAVPHLRNGGVIINLTSIASHVAFVNASAYCASKAALELLTKVWAVELAPQGIRTVSIAPGNVRTSMNDHLMADPAYAQLMIDMTPSGRNGEVSDISHVAVFLASDAASYVNGAALLVDGAWCAR